MTAAAAESVLEAHGLSFAYRDRRVFEGVDLAIAPGEIVCLIGASGCGKSSLLKVLAGLERPDQGTVKRQTTLRGEDAPRTAVVFQSPALLPWLDVAGNVAFGLQFSAGPGGDRSERARRVQSALAEVGLADAGRLRTSALSGGMAQRVALARALARSPQLIFLDEPFSALDALSRESMQDLLVALVRRHHASALLVTHDLDEALRIGDRVLLLSGRPASIRASWKPDGTAPRLHRSQALNGLRETLLDALATPATTLAA